MTTRVLGEMVQGCGREKRMGLECLVRLVSKERQ